MRVGAPKDVIGKVVSNFGSQLMPHSVKLDAEVNRELRTLRRGQSLRIFVLLLNSLPRPRRLGQSQQQLLNSHPNLWQQLRLRLLRHLDQFQSVVLASQFDDVANFLHVQATAAPAASAAPSKPAEEDRIGPVVSQRVVYWFLQACLLFRTYA